MVSLSELKEYLRISHNDEDLFLATAIDAATTRLEQEIDTKFISQGWDIYFENIATSNLALLEQYGEFYAKTTEVSRLALPFGRLIGVESISYFLDDNSEGVVDLADVYADTVGHYPTIDFNGAVFPLTGLRKANSIRARVRCGFGDTREAVPKKIRMAVMALAASLYEYRGDEFPEIPGVALMLIEPYRRFKIGRH